MKKGQYLVVLTLMVGNCKMEQKSQIPQSEAQKKNTFKQYTTLSYVFEQNCRIASNKENEVEACVKCFESAVTKVGIKKVQARMSCSRHYLSPHFSECTEMFEDVEKDPKKGYSNELFSKISKCFKNVRARNIEERCFRGTKNVPPLNAVDTILCGKQSLPEKHKVVNLVILDDRKYL